VGTDACEEKLRAVKQPAILHFATHGCFVEEFPSPPDTTDPMATHPLSIFPSFDPLKANGRLNNQGVSPMLRSFLALAGAQETYNNWGRGHFPQTHLDGILMADEVIDMDFSRTLLVTLSACDTAVGANVRGEGSVGIQRAFLMAGARHVMATLWPIDDGEAVRFMELFYKRVIAGETPPAAMIAVQRQLLREHSKDQGLARAINLAAPFVVTSSGP
jgi:CHAT domain-containing protein